MSTPARYSGVCPECGERGDLICLNVSADAPGAWWQHAACPDVPDASTVRPGEVACADCQLIHPAGACDR